MSAHTPGPWEYYHEVIPRSANSSLCEIHFDTVRQKGGKNIVRLHNKSDARLIAAAPELLRLLALAMPYVARKELAIAIKDIIAKAEGGE